MDIAILNDAARTFHLVGLALGLGAAIMADTTAFAWLKRPLKQAEIQALQRYHHAVTVGLLIFWFSGVVILSIKTGFEAQNFSAKLVMKLCVVAVLTFNAVLIARIGLPILQNSEGRNFCQIATHDRLRLAVLAALSTASWGSALALGMFKILATMKWALISDIFIGVYAVTLFGAVFAAWVAPAIRIALQQLIGRRVKPLRPLSGLQIPTRVL